MLCAVERSELRGLSDEQLIEVAYQERRVLVTRDVGDFSRLALQFAAERRSHQGLILVSPRRFVASAAGIGPLARALAAVLEAHPKDGDLANGWLWLE